MGRTSLGEIATNVQRDSATRHREEVTVHQRPPVEAQPWAAARDGPRPVRARGAPRPVRSAALGSYRTMARRDAIAVAKDQLWTVMQGKPWLVSMGTGRVDGKSGIVVATHSCDESDSLFASSTKRVAASMASYAWRSPKTSKGTPPGSPFG